MVQTRMLQDKYFLSYEFIKIVLIPFFIIFDLDLKIAPKLEECLYIT